jgi:hypothetical protein
MQAQKLLLPVVDRMALKGLMEQSEMPRNLT